VVSKRFFGKYFVLALLGAAVLTVGCGGQEQDPPRLSVNVFGYGPSPAGTADFVSGMPLYEGAEMVRIKLTQPSTGRVLGTSTFPLLDNRGLLPELSFGEKLRLDLEVLNGQQIVVASGATPTFDFTSSTPWRSYRLMISPINAFSPVGSLVADPASGTQRLAQSRFDYRAFTPGSGERNWLGRVGHVAVPLDGGKVLIVGGADPISFPVPGQVPSLRATHADIQIFDPATGYFTDLAADDMSAAVGALGVDRLERSRAYHTVTALGQGRFLVAGGWTVNAGEMRTVNKIEIIDVNAPAGTRVQTLADLNFSEAILRTQRAMHTATYRVADGSVVIAGGFGRDGEILNTFEVIHVPSGTVGTNPGIMQSGRVGHSAVLSNDGARVWLLGGRTETTVLNTTEVLQYDGQTTASVSSIPMNRARFGASLLRLSPQGGQDVMVVGGFTSIAGQATDSYEIGSLQRGAFFSDDGYRIRSARGGAVAVELHHSRDIVLIGGLDSNGSIVPRAERLVYRGFGQSVPYEAAEGIGSFHQVRYGASATAVDNGLILVTGGVDAQATTSFDNAEYFNPLDPVRPRSGG
jgi:hypothetical protein